MSARQRRRWNEEEDKVLIEAVAQATRDSQPIVWHEIAKNIPGRTNKDCRKRWHSKLAADVKKGTWTQSEDERLYDAVKTHGTKWVVVANEVRTRNGDQCSKRWNNTVDPYIDHSTWTAEEEKLLLEVVAKYGHQWTAIVANHFPGRTSLSAKNQYYLINRRKGKSIGSSSGRSRASKGSLSPASGSTSMPSSEASMATAQAISGNPRQNSEVTSGDEDGSGGASAISPGSMTPRSRSKDMSVSSGLQTPQGDTMSSYYLKGHSADHRNVNSLFGGLSGASNAPISGTPPSYPTSRFQSHSSFNQPPMNKDVPQPMGFPQSHQLSHYSNISGNEDTSMLDILHQQTSSFFTTHGQPHTTDSAATQNIQAFDGSTYSISNTEDVQSNIRDDGSDDTRRVIVNAVCSTEQLGRFIRAVTETTISATIQTGD